MKLDIFEGFKRLNIIVLILILLIGLVISFNNSAYIDGDPVYYKDDICLFTHTKTEYLNHGAVSIQYCFDEDYSYSSKSDYAEADKLTYPQIEKYEKQLFDIWLSDTIKGVGYTLLFLAGYFIFCKTIKYIVIGFIKNE